MKTDHSEFTLIELLVVIAVIGSEKTCLQSSAEKALI